MKPEEVEDAIWMVGVFERWGFLRLSRETEQEAGCRETSVDVCPCLQPAVSAL